MGQRTRKLIGTFLFLGFIALYMALASVIGLSLPDNKMLVMAFYFVAGFAWVFPAKYIIGWMQRPDEVQDGA